MNQNNFKKRVLIIDDDQGFCQQAVNHLSSDNLQILTAQRWAEGIDVCTRHHVDVVLLDQKIQNGSGPAPCTSILDRNDQTKIIFLSAAPSFDTAVQAIRSGAFDYLSKPLDLGELALAINRALKALSIERAALVEEYKSHKESEETVLIGDSEGLAEIDKLVELAASVDASVLITGETGTGKNVVARTIHYRSPARTSAFITINCASLPENLIEAELFGYDRGAFTGAVTAKRGIFEMAEGGTLFLDEIGEMPIHLQTKLLGVLEDKRIKRIGGESIRPVHVRILAATSKDLEQALGKSFRKDLYYRLSVIRIHLPPLRERRQDIPKLCEHLLAQMTSCRRLEINDHELQRLMAYDWPGNVRELKNVLERAAILQHGREARPSELLEGKIQSDPCSLPLTPDAPVRSLEELEKDYIRMALESHKGNRSKVARLLGISLSTLKRKIKTFDLR